MTNSAAGRTEAQSTEEGFELPLCCFSNLMWLKKESEFYNDVRMK